MFLFHMQPSSLQRNQPLKSTVQFWFKTLYCLSRLAKRGGTRFYSARNQSANHFSLEKYEKLHKIPASLKVDGVKMCPRVSILLPKACKCLRRRGVALVQNKIFWHDCVPAARVLMFGLYRRKMHSPRTKKSLVSRYWNARWLRSPPQSANHYLVMFCSALT